MKLPRRKHHLFYVCGTFIAVNIVLYSRYEDAFPTNSGEAHTRRNVNKKLPRPDETLVSGLIDPLTFIKHTLKRYNVEDMFPKALRPEESGETSDRITRQLDFLNILKKGLNEMDPPMTQIPRMRPYPRDKIIYVTSGVRMASWEMKREKLVEDHCPITNCFLIDTPSALPPGIDRPDAVIFRGALNALKRISLNRTKEEVWIVYQLESPLSASMGRFTPEQTPNWTATFRTSSTLVTPYEKFVSGLPAWRFEKDGDDGFEKPSFNEQRDFSAGKFKSIAWFVTNCNTQSDRMRYARDLANYITVDIFGSCGTHTCSKNNNGCSEMLKKEYKFYLAFENSNCREYITEKLYSNALANDVIPIVMGAHPADYRKMAPHHSYIHVDDFASSRDLAAYLHRIDKNDTLFNEYFKWRGTGAFINTKFWCRLCAMLHARDIDNYIHSYDDIHRWWSDGACVTPAADRAWSPWSLGQQSVSVPPSNGTL